eukprot:GSA25T00025061001.1
MCKALWPRKANQVAGAHYSSDCTKSGHHQGQKSCVVVQGPKGSGKTAGLALAVAAGVDLRIKHCQALVLCMSKTRDFDKFFNIFTLFHPVKLLSLMGGGTTGAGCTTSGIGTSSGGTAVVPDQHSAQPGGSGTSPGLASVGTNNPGSSVVPTNSNTSIAPAGGAPDSVPPFLAGETPMPMVGFQGPEIEELQFKAQHSVRDAESCSVLGGPSSPTPAPVNIAGMTPATPSATGVPTSLDTTAWNASAGASNRELASTTAIGPITPLNAQVICGRPGQVLDLLNKHDICLDYVSVLVLDDAQDLVLEETSKEILPPSSDSGTPSTGSEMDQVIQVSHIVECRLLAGKLRYVLLSRMMASTETPGSRKVLRLLKSSVMKKKNLFSVMPDLPTKLRPNVKHYVVEAPREKWLKILKALVTSLMFPKAIIFCDDKKRVEQYPAQMKALGLSASINLGSRQDSIANMPKRMQAIQDFSGGKNPFLFTVSDPSVCQNVTSSCVFHMDVPAEMPSIYSLRLLSLDPTPTRDVVSILFVEKADKLTQELAKIFQISFLDMPYEFIPL